MKTLKIGIADYDRMKARAMAIACGEHKPARDEPTMWFASIACTAHYSRRSNGAGAGTRRNPRCSPSTHSPAFAGIGPPSTGRAYYPAYPAPEG